MEDFKVIKCPSCGSSNIETDSENIAECSHCGSKLLVKNSHPKQVVYKYSKLIVGLLLLIIAGGILAFYLNHQSKTTPPAELPKSKPVLPKIGVPLINNFKVPKINSKAMTITKEDLENKKNSAAVPTIKIIHKTQGKTHSGGIYWILTIRNDSDKTVVRPGVIASLFDENNRRIEEQKGWSKLAQLEPGKQTDVLLFIANPPTGEFRTELQGMGSFSTFIQSKQESIEIVDYIVKPKANSTSHVEIIGDVKNTHDYQVDFVRVIALAKDADGNTIGLADGFVSHSSLTTNAQSGFKITAGTFVTQTPITWSLWAFGTKHRDKL